MQISLFLAAMRSSARLRQKSDLPVIFLTSKEEEIDELFDSKWAPPLRKAQRAEVEPPTDETNPRPDEKQIQVRKREQ